MTPKKITTIAMGISKASIRIFSASTIRINQDGKEHKPHEHQTAANDQPPIYGSRNDLPEDDNG